jgi:hypothetical protein
VFSPDDGHIVAQNVYRKAINILGKIVHHIGSIYEITQGYFHTFWALPVCRTIKSENHNLLYTIKFHLMAAF